MISALTLLLVFSSAEPISATAATTPAAQTAATASDDNKPAHDDAVVPPVTDAVLVTATRSERSVSNLPVSATVVTEKEIRTAPARSVDDVIRTIPGVTPTLVSASGSTPNNQHFSMNGLGGTRALVLLDGVPLHDPYSGIVQWQNVALDTLRQIEVVRGGNASLFGNFALGGTVNLITRPIEQNDISADLSYGSGTTTRAALTVDYVVNPAVSLRVSHHQLNSDGFIRVPNAGAVDVDAWIDNAITSGRAELRPDDQTVATLNASTGKIDISQGTPLTYSKRNISTFSASVQRSIGASNLFSVKAYYQNQTEHLVNSSIIGANRASEYETQDGKTPSSGAGASAEWTMERKGVIPLLSVGIDLQQVKANEDRISFNRAGAVTQLENVGGQQRFAGIFGSASWRPSERIEVLGSARLDLFYNQDGADIIVGGTATHYPSTSTHELDPRISARYALSATSALRASVYRAFNAPNLRDLYRSNQTGNTLILGNPYLTPETLVGGELGGEWSNNRMRIEVNLFRSTIDGLQSRTAVAGQPNVYRNLNLGSSRSQGVEITGDARLSRQWSLNAGYTFADAVVTSDPDPTLAGKYVIEVPRHSGSLALRFNGDHGTDVTLRGRVLSRSYDDAANVVFSPANRVVDFSISQVIRPWISAYVLVENAFDENYYLALAATSFRSGLPRTITGGVRLNGFPWRK